MAMPEAEVVRVLDMEIEQEVQDERFVVNSVDRLDWCIRQISESKRGASIHRMRSAADS